jgi:hypothetical protein
MSTDAQTAHAASELDPCILAPREEFHHLARRATCVAHGAKSRAVWSGSTLVRSQRSAGFFVVRAGFLVHIGVDEDR